MKQFWIAVALSLYLIGANAQDGTVVQDYVPDSKTALRIAEAILDARYGNERVQAMQPLHVNSSEKEFWIVEGWGLGAPASKGGGMAVWINRKTAAVQILKSK